MKLQKRFDIGKAVAEKSGGRIELVVERETGTATLRGEFTRMDRAPLRFKKGAGWRYHASDGAEWWTLNISKLATACAIADTADSATVETAEPSAVEVGGIYTNGNKFYVVTRATAKTAWFRPLVKRTTCDAGGRHGYYKPTKRAYGDEFMKRIDSLRLRKWDGKPVEWFSYEN